MLPAFWSGLVASAVLMAYASLPQVKEIALETADGLMPHNVAVSPAVLEGRRGLRLTLAEATRRELEQLPPAQRQQREVHQLATIRDLDFSSGVIEVELAGAPAPDAPTGARGFVGIAFRVQPNNDRGAHLRLLVDRHIVEHDDGAWTPQAPSTRSYVWVKCRVLCPH